MVATSPVAVIVTMPDVWTVTDPITPTGAPGDSGGGVTGSACEEARAVARSKIRFTASMGPSACPAAAWQESRQPEVELRSWRKAPAHSPQLFNS